MKESRLNEIAELLTGLKRYEWSRIKVAIERAYDSASCKIAIDDAESIKRNLVCRSAECAKGAWERVTEETRRMTRRRGKGR